MAKLGWWDVRLRGDKCFPLLRRICSKSKICATERRSLVLEMELLLEDEAIAEYLLTAIEYRIRDHESLVEHRTQQRTYWRSRHVEEMRQRWMEMGPNA